MVFFHKPLKYLLPRDRSSIDLCGFKKTRLIGYSVCPSMKIPVNTEQNREDESRWKSHFLVSSRTSPACYTAVVLRQLGEGSSRPPRPWMAGMVAWVGGWILYPERNSPLVVGLLRNLNFETVEMFVSDQLRCPRPTELDK